MLRIGICDDECYARDALRLELEKLLEETEEIVYEFSGGETAVSWLKKHPGEIDFLFLDVEMKGVNGIRTAEQIREFDTRIQIVFVTGFRDFVFEGYRVQAVDYLVKPVDADRLSSVLSRVRRQLAIFGAATAPHWECAFACAQTAGAGAAEAVCLSEWGRRIQALPG